MHYIRKFILVILPVLFYGNLFAQTNFLMDTVFRNLVDSNIASLKLNNAPVLSFYSFGDSPSFGKDSLTGIGKRLVFQNFYLIYTKDSRTTIIKYIEYDSSLDVNICNPRIAKSQELKLNSDTLIPWVKVNKSKLKHERLLPYIYESKIDGMIIYDESYTLHMPIYHIGLYYSDNVFFHSAHEMNLYEKHPFISNLGTNLNYRYNSSTALYKLCSDLKYLIKLCDNAFVFTP